MSSPALAPRPASSRLPAAAGAALLLILATAAAFAVVRGGPDWALLAAQSTAVHVHLACAVSALALGCVLLFGAKGDRVHRLLGWSWAVLMLATAASSFFIRGINDGGLSLIHALSGWTVVAAPMAVYAARRHKIAVHRSAMTWLYVGGLVGAGAFAALPGRLIWQVVVG